MYCRHMVVNNAKKKKDYLLHRKKMMLSSLASSSDKYLSESSYNTRPNKKKIISKILRPKVLTLPNFRLKKSNNKIPTAF